MRKLFYKHSLGIKLSFRLACMSLKKDDSEERKKRMLIRGMREGQRELVVEQRKQEVSSLMEDFEERTPSSAM